MVCTNKSSETVADAAARSSLMARGFALGLVRRAQQRFDDRGVALILILLEGCERLSVEGAPVEQPTEIDRPKVELRCGCCEFVLTDAKLHRLDKVCSGEASLVMLERCEIIECGAERRLSPVPCAIKALENADRARSTSALRRYKAETSQYLTFKFRVIRRLSVPKRLLQRLRRPGITELRLILARARSYRGRARAPPPSPTASSSRRAPTAP